MVGEVQQAKAEGGSGNGVTTRDLPNGMREVRINHRAMEAK